MDHISDCWPERLKRVPKPPEPSFKKNKIPKVVIPTDIYAEIGLREFGKNDLLVLLWIARYQFGYNRLRAAKIPVKMFSEALGIDKSTASSTMSKLEEMQVIYEVDGFYKIRAEVGNWNVSYRKGVDLSNLNILEISHAREQRKRIIEQKVQE